MTQPLLIGKSDIDIAILPRMANRHGLIAGATGTGKTVSLRVLAEHFSAIGVPVFMADVKGDLGSMAEPGGGHEGIAKRVQKMGLAGFEYQSYPVTFWDVFGEFGHPVRTTISEMGPLLLARLLSLNETQAGVLSLVFRLADDEGLLLLDLKDLRALVAWVGENANEFKLEYGNVSTATIGAIQRSLLALEEQGGDLLFGEPALNLFDLMRTEGDKGVINILDSRRLMMSPKVYATLLLWMLSELFENLPEVGDPEKPRLVFFFDEAHLLFADSPKALTDKIEQVVKLIRSKGVGIYFVTQNPADIPDPVLAQLGNKIQHALRAYTPKEQKAVRTAASTFRVNPDLNTEEAITQLKVGEALISVLDEDGAPTVVERALVCPPHSLLGSLSSEAQGRMIKSSMMFGRYEQIQDRNSAYEVLIKRREEAAKLRADNIAKEAEEKAKRREQSSKSKRQGFLESFAKSAIRSIGSRLGTRIVRGVLGSLLGR